MMAAERGRATHALAAAFPDAFVQGSVGTKYVLEQSSMSEEQGSGPELAAEEVRQWPTPDESTTPATDPGRYREREHIERYGLGSASRDDTGKVMVKTEPCPGALSTDTLPPCASVNCFTIARPSPVPPAGRAGSAR